MTYQLNDLEAKARALFDARRSSPEFSPMENGVLCVFHAMWSYSLTIQHIDQIASAMQSITGYSWSVEVHRLVKAKVLRARKDQSRRVMVYEVAL